MNKFIITLLLLSSLTASGQSVSATVGTGRNQHSANRMPRYHNHPLTPLLFEDFENPAGYDLFGWGVDDPVEGVVNPDYTTVVLYGTQSLLIEEAEDDPTMATNSFAASDHVFVAFRFRPTLLPDSTDSTIFRLNDASGNCQFRITVNSDTDMKMQFACTGTAYQFGTALSLNTTYTVWLEYENDNGANCYGTMAISTGSLRPTSGAGFVDGTGTSTATQVSHVQIGKDGSEASQHASFIIDHLLIDDVQINDWP